MKTLRKVCEMVGTTRKTLRGYDEVGLLHPTAKTENGYWLYDDEAISRLRFIQIFADAGYERSTIKEILENPAADFGDEYDHVIHSLEKRKEAISQQIHTLTRLKLIARLSLRFRSVLEKTDPVRLFPKEEPLDNASTIVQEYAAKPPQEAVEADAYLPLICQLTMLSCMKEEDPSSAPVQELVGDICSYLPHLEEVNGENSSLNDQEISRLTEDWFRTHLKGNPVWKEKLGEDGIGFILSAFRIHIERNIE